MGLLGAIGGALGSFFGPIGTAVGSALGGALDSDMQQDRAEGYSSAEAAKNREFQREMANTSYQRGMEDLRKAGLNPMLAYSQGGAIVPTGSMASYPGAVGAQFRSADAAMATSEASATSANAAMMQAETAQKIGNSTVEKIKQEIEYSKTDQQRVDALVLTLGEQRQNLIKEGYNLTEVGNQLRATIDKVKAEVTQVNTQSFLNVATERLRQLEAQLAGMDVQAASKFNNLGRDVKQLAPLVDLLKIFIGRGRNPVN